MLNFILGLFESHYYSLLHQAFIVLHVAAALLALVVAPGAMIATKGGRAHITWGRIFFWAMVVTNLLALGLLFWRFNTFLFGVTILSLNGVLTGYRALHRKQGQVRWFDWALSWGVLVTGVGLVAWGALTAFGITAQFMPSSGNIPAIMAIFPLVFGILLVSDARTDLRIYQVPSPDRRWWWYHHMDRMLGSYIALCTALMVQQVGPRLPEGIAWVAWVAPAAIGTPLIAMWIGRYKRKFAPKTQVMPAQTTVTSS